MTQWNEYSRFVIALITILEPFMAIPVLLGLTQGYTPPERARTVNLAVMTVMVVLMVSALTGEKLLHLMGTSLASFRVGGGIVLLLMALAMLRASIDPLRATVAETTATDNQANIAVVPLGIPLLAGPGAISTTIIQAQRDSTLTHLLLVSLCITLAGLFVWVILRLAVPIGAWLGPVGINIISRFLGLLLAAIAVETMAAGLRQLFPVLAG